MGKPADTDRFEAFSVDDITVYAAKDVLDSELKNKALDFYIEGYGRYTLELLE